MKQKRLLSLALALLLMISLLSACGSGDKSEGGASQPEGSSSVPNTPNVPDPAPADPAPAPADPAPAPAEPNPAPAEPDPAPAEPDPAPAEPDPAPAEPDPAPAEPDPAPAEPDLAPAEPNPAPAEPNPAPAEPDPAPSEPDPAPAPSGVDLAAFSESILSQYEFGFIGLAEGELLDGFYPGMTGIDTQQCVVYICMISMNNGEFGLVQVTDAADVDAVKAVFQARVDYMVGDGNGPGGAQYPMAMDQWEFNSRIVSNGNYVMMVVHEDCDEIVAAFNELF